MHLDDLDHSQIILLVILISIIISVSATVSVISLVGGNNSSGKTLVTQTVNRIIERRISTAPEGGGSTLSPDEVIKLLAEDIDLNSDLLRGQQIVANIKRSKVTIPRTGETGFIFSNQVEIILNSSRPYNNEDISIDEVEYSYTSRATTDPEYKILVPSPSEEDKEQSFSYMALGDEDSVAIGRRVAVVSYGGDGIVYREGVISEYNPEDGQSDSFRVSVDLSNLRVPAIVVDSNSNILGFIKRANNTGSVKKVSTKILET